MGLILTSAPTEEPVTLEEAKAHLRLEIDDDDTLVGNLITAAREYVEKQTHRALVTQTWKLTLDAFPSRVGSTYAGYWLYSACDCLRLPQPPLQSVTSIRYYDQNGVQQTLDSSGYIVDATTEPGRVCLPPGTLHWPATQSGRTNAVEVTYVAGYGDAEDAPQSLKSAILLVLAHLYENREATTALNLKAVPMAVESLLGQFDWGGYQ